MKLNHLNRVPAASALCVSLLVSAALLTNCEAGPATQPRVTSSRTIRPLSPFWAWFYRLPPSRQNALAETNPTIQMGLDFNNPTVGGPLYYSDNLNWEEAPPFGLW